MFLRLQPHVDRRTGGLEIRMMTDLLFLSVDRRTGGLETTKFFIFFSLIVDRRTGGLEIKNLRPG